MAETVGGYDSESMLKQAQNIWTMLDDMAANNPEAYKKFIDKQMQEGKTVMAPPGPHMAVKTSLQKPTKSTFYINFCSWHKVPAPKTGDDPVPVIGVPIENMDDKSGTYQMTSVAFNPGILEKYGRNSANLTDQDTLVNLAMDYIEDQQHVKISRRYTILGKDTPHMGCLKYIQKCFTKTSTTDKQFESSLDQLEKSFAPLAPGSKDSLLHQLANISVDGSQSESNASNSDQSHIKMPFDEKPVSKPNLIQEIPNGSKTVCIMPDYGIETISSDTGAECIQVKISLPGVSSVQQCELEISQDDLSLQVPHRYSLHVQLPHAIDEDEATAKFNKKLSLLTITMPHVKQ